MYIQYDYNVGDVLLYSPRLVPSYSNIEYDELLPDHYMEECIVIDKLYENNGSFLEKVYKVQFSNGDIIKIDNFDHELAPTILMKWRLYCEWRRLK